ncbi:DUF2721 domain-containing protein [Caballeronia sp. LZ001]|uniref:DUF2721 domain-containing protein n=1 Tax=Caballeronia sp. LZ001 TaxID=3038553 RepID=UPI00285D3659|nr:DUF2721 domain-containing protein [Caballeronia sp. LZ001]MDR5806541.1 DUF2721 domain-containing protein [Caballeronia sp. LZ001]
MLLGQIFVSAFDRYRTLVTEYRAIETSNNRRRHIAEQIPLYKRRCEQMQRATVIGAIAAMMLIFTLLSGTNVTIIGHDWAPLKYLGAASTVIGLALLLWAASYLILENRCVIDVLHSEVKDLPVLHAKPEYSQISKIRISYSLTDESE